MRVFKTEIAKRRAAAAGSVPRNAQVGGVELL